MNLSSDNQGGRITEVWICEGLVLYNTHTVIHTYPLKASRERRCLGLWVFFSGAGVFLPAPPSLVPAVI